MDYLVNNREEIAFLIARLFLGCLFFFQGYDAVFKVKIKNIIDTYDNQFENKGIPRWLTKLGAAFTALSELVGGGLLLLGVFTYPALCLLGLNLIVAAIGFGMTTPVWDSKFVFPRLILILFLLLAPESWNIYSFDFLLK